MEGHILLSYKRALLPEEVAEIIGVPLSTVWKKARTGEWPKLPGLGKRTIRFDPHALYTVLYQPEEDTRSLKIRRKHGP